MPRPTSHRKHRLQPTWWILHHNQARFAHFSSPPPLFSSVMSVWARWWTTCSPWRCEPPPQTSPARTPSATSPTGGSSFPVWSVRELHLHRLPAPAARWRAEQPPVQAEHWLTMVCLRHICSSHRDGDTSVIWICTFCRWRSTLSGQQHSRKQICCEYSYNTQMYVSALS